MTRRKTNAPQGRPFGSRNIVNREWKREATEAAKAAAKLGITPLEYMLNVLRDDNAPTIRRDDMAKAAAPYMHPRLASVDVGGNKNNPLVIKSDSLADVELARRIAFILAKGAAVADANG